MIRLPRVSAVAAVSTGATRLKGGVFEDRLGPYIAKQGAVIPRYSIPFDVAKGQIVQAIEDRVDRVLVQLHQGTCIYIDSLLFDATFERTIV